MQCTHCDLPIEPRARNSSWIHATNPALGEFDKHRYIACSYANNDYSDRFQDADGRDLKASPKEEPVVADTTPSTDSNAIPAPRWDGIDRRRTVSSPRIDELTTALANAEQRCVDYSRMIDERDRKLEEMNASLNEKDLVIIALERRVNHMAAAPPRPELLPDGTPNFKSDAEEIAVLRATLAAERTRITELNAAYERAVIDHKGDISIIGKALLAEAENRGWCDEYDTFVDNVNEDLTVELPTRHAEFGVELVYTVRVRTTVTARDADNAVSFAYNEVPERMLFRTIDSEDSPTGFAFDAGSGWTFDRASSSAVKH